MKSKPVNFFSRYIPSSKSIGLTFAGTAVGVTIGALTINEIVVKPLNDINLARQELIDLKEVTRGKQKDDLLKTREQVTQLEEALTGTKESLENNRRKIIIKNTLKSTVTVRIARPGEKDIIGSGFIFKEDGRRFMFSANHVIPAKQFQERGINITLSNKEKFTILPSAFENRLLMRRFPEDDFVIMEISPEQKLPEGAGCLKLRKGPPEHGETVVAIGSPFGYEGTVTTGVIGGLKRDILTPTEVQMNNLIQLSVPVNPGDSGGPVVDMRDEVVGMTFAMRSDAQQIAFAIQSDILRKCFDKALKDEALMKKAN